MVSYIGDMMELSKSLALEAKKKGKLAFLAESGIKFARFKEHFRSIERGTVILGSRGNRIIIAYPHIKRIFSLQNGLSRNIKSEEVFIEEKIDGYNIRIAGINGKILAFSRGGFIDYFITEKVQELAAVKKFFASFPEAVLCAEAIGNTPYTRPTGDYDVRLLVFDIDKGNGEFFSCEEKYRMLEKFGLDGVPSFGRFKVYEINKIRQIALNALKGKREGIVIKSSDRSEAVKFVNPYSDINDIELNAKLFFEMPTGFYAQRILRSAMFVKEFGLDHRQYAQQLGNAFFSSLLQAFALLESGEEIFEEYEITIRSRETWNRLVRQGMKEDHSWETSAREYVTVYRRVQRGKG